MPGANRGHCSRYGKESGMPDTYRRSRACPAFREPKLSPVQSSHFLVIRNSIKAAEGIGCLSTSGVADPNIRDPYDIRTLYVKRNNIVGVHDLIADSHKELGFHLLSST